MANAQSVRPTQPAGQAFARGSTVWYQPDQSSPPRPIYTDTTFTPRQVTFRGLILVKGAFRDTSYIQFKQHGQERYNCLVLDTTGWKLFLIRDCQNAELSPEGRRVAYGSYGENIWPGQKDGIDSSPELFIHDLLAGKSLDITSSFREVIQQDKAAGKMVKSMSFGLVRWLNSMAGFIPSSGISKMKVIGVMEYSATTRRAGKLSLPITKT